MWCVMPAKRDIQISGQVEKTIHKTTPVTDEDHEVWLKTGPKKLGRGTFELSNFLTNKVTECASLKPDKMIMGIFNVLVLKGSWLHSDALGL